MRCPLINKPRTLQMSNVAHWEETSPPLLVNVNSFHAYVQFVGRLSDVHDAGEKDVLYLAFDNAWHNDCAVRI